MRKEIGTALMAILGMLSASHGAITIELVGDGSGYDENGVNAFRSTGVVKGFDVDADHAYGTEGLFFFGDGLPNDGGGNSFATHTQVGASWATFAQGADFTSVAEGGTFSYAIIDDPSLPIAPDVDNWGIRSGGGVANVTPGAGTWQEIVTFTIDGSTPDAFRIGIMAGNLNNVNWNPSGLRISVDGGTPAEVNDLPGTTGQASFVFFDVSLNGATAGTFSIEGQRRAASQGASMAGVTFDVIDPPDGATLAFSPGSLPLELSAPDTSVDGIITASYTAGEVTSGDVTIVSLTADAGFSAAPVADLGLGNLTEDITVTYDNSSIGLLNGQSTNSTLEIVWTEIGSGVSNTSSVPLSVTYINEPNGFTLAPASLSLTLNGPETSTNGTIVASYVEGTIPADIEIVSIVVTNGFSVDPDSFVLGTGNASQNVLVTYDNTGALVNHGDTADSVVVVTWTETGSGVTNTANGSVDVFYYNPGISTTVIAGYDFDDGTGTATTNVTFQDANVTASGYGVGTGLISVISANNNALFEELDAENNLFGTANGISFGTSSDAFGYIKMNNADNLALAMTEADYMVFTVTPTEDYAMDLISFTFRSRINQLVSSAERWALFSSVGGFASTNDAIATGRTTDVGTWNGASTKNVVDLSGAEFQELEGTVEFRLYIYGGSDGYSSATLFDKVILNGDVYALALPPVSASVADGSFIMSWADGRTYNVLTNTYLPDPNGWSVSESDVSSPVSIPIGGADQVFFKLGK
ncbi:hypothetical protein [Pontiella sp.]|uniref:hypothetical protein n=2 Tax=Pontiella sp. TaxID=2837462 RepID=UPI003564174A